MLDSLIKNTTLIFFILLPVFFLPITSESYEYNKMALLIISVCILSMLHSIQIAKKRQITFINNSFGAPLFFLAGITLVSTFFQSPNQVLALTTPLSTATLIASVVLYFLLIQGANDEQIGKVMQILVFEAVFIAVYVIFLLTGILPNSIYTPVGTLSATFSFLSVIGIFLGSLMAVKFSDQNLNIRYKISSLLPHIIAFVFIFSTGVFLLAELLTEKKPLVLPFSFGWMIFLETLKNIRTLFLGVGPANFITAFSLAKPFGFNATPYWNVIFTQSSSFLLSLGTEVGLLAGIIYLFILLKSFRLLKSSSSSNLSYRISLIYTLVLQIFFPSSMVLFILTVIFLYLSAEKHQKSGLAFEKLGIFSYFGVLPVILFCGFIFYFSGKFYLAEVYFKRSLDHLLNKEGTQVYKNQDTAIGLNPYLDRYHAAFSQTNLALANNLASKKDLTETDKQNIPNLVKQAIDHARTAVILNRTNELNWDNLARVYSGLIGYAQGAENWSAYSFQQKLALDPLNPNTYISLSSLNLSLNKFSVAENMARRAVTVKPDLANAYYYLNLSLQGQNKYKEAYEELEKSYNFLKADSADAKKVASDLQELAKQINLMPKEEASPSGFPETSSSAQISTPPDQTQNLDLNQATSSGIQIPPDTLPTISLEKPPANP